MDNNNKENILKASLDISINLVFYRWDTKLHPSLLKLSFPRRPEGSTSHYHVMSCHVVQSLPTDLVRSRQADSAVSCRRKSGGFFFSSAAAVTDWLSERENRACLGINPAAARRCLRGRCSGSWRVWDVCWSGPGRRRTAAAACGTRTSAGNNYTPPAPVPQLPTQQITI